MCWSQGRSLYHVEPMPTVVADLALSLLHLSKTLFHPVLDYVVFFEDSATKMR